MSYKVEIVSPQEAEKFLNRLRPSPENLNARRSIIFPGSLEIKGEFFMTCRDASSGEIEWEHSQENLLTDYGRRYWMENRLNSVQLGFCPSIEVPNSGRYSISTNGSANASFASGNITPTNSPATNTKTISTTFGTPSSNRTLGTIFIARSFNVIPAELGVLNVVAFSVLTPPKTQSTTQTLEVVYKISMNPIV